MIIEVNGVKIETERHICSDDCKEHSIEEIEIEDDACIPAPSSKDNNLINEHA